MCITISIFSPDTVFADELRQIQEERVRTAYACGAAASPKLFKWFKEWEAYRRWDESDPPACYAGNLALLR